MGQLRPRREVIVKGFELAMRGKHQMLIRIEPLTGMNVDAASMIIRKTEMLRLRPEYKGSKQLRPAVRRAVAASGLPFGLTYAYEVVIMCYYNQIWQYVAAIRRKRRLPHGKRHTHRQEQPSAV